MIAVVLSLAFVVGCEKKEEKTGAPNSAAPAAPGTPEAPPAEELGALTIEADLGDLYYAVPAQSVPLKVTGGKAPYKFSVAGSWAKPRSNVEIATVVEDSVLHVSPFERGQEVTVTVEDSSGAKKSAAILLRTGVRGQLIRRFGQKGAYRIHEKKAQTQMTSLLVDDGLILLAHGQEKTLIMNRMTLNGAPDTAFGVNGRLEVESPFDPATIGSHALRAFPDYYRHLIIASKKAFARIGLDGKTDTTFAGGAGLAQLPRFGDSLEARISGIYPGKEAILVVGDIDSTGYQKKREKVPLVFVAKYSRDGVLDLSFGKDGVLVLWEGHESLATSYDETLSAMEAPGTDLFVARPFDDKKTRGINVWKIKQEGKLDERFGNGGKFSRFAAMTWSGDWSLIADFSGGFSLFGRADLKEVTGARMNVAFRHIGIGDDPASMSLFPLVDKLSMFRGAFHAYEGVYFVEEGFERLRLSGTRENTFLRRSLEPIGSFGFDGASSLPKDGWGASYDPLSVVEVPLDMLLVVMPTTSRGDLGASVTVRAVTY